MSNSNTHERSSSIEVSQPVSMDMTEDRGAMRIFGTGGRFSSAWCRSESRENGRSEKPQTVATLEAVAGGLDLSGPIRRKQSLSTVPGSIKLSA